MTGVPDAVRIREKVKIRRKSKKKKKKRRERDAVSDGHGRKETDMDLGELYNGVKTALTLSDHCCQVVYNYGSSRHHAFEHAHNNQGNNSAKPKGHYPLVPLLEIRLEIRSPLLGLVPAPSMKACEMARRGPDTCQPDTSSNSTTVATYNTENDITSDYRTTWDSNTTSHLVHASNLRQQSIFDFEHDEAVHYFAAACILKTYCRLENLDPTAQK
jgi:hypothetical protein